MGPILMGGHWTLAPPGTHKLRLLSDDDTLTHSDKQLKRNLSFVWKAPDAPRGDFRFHITVVQSYFVHWAGVESLVVRDRSRGSGTGGNVATMKEWDLASLLQERLRAKTTGPWRALEPTATSGAAPSYGSQETPTALVHALPEGTGSETLAPLGKVHLKEQQVAETSSSQPFTPQQSVTASRLGVHHEAANNSPRMEKTSNHEGTSEGFLLESILHLTSTGSTPVPQTGLWSLPSWISQTKTDFLDHSQGADQQQTQTRWAQRPTPTPGAPQTVLFSRVYPASPRSDDKNLTPAASAVNTESPNFVPTASAHLHPHLNLHLIQHPLLCPQLHVIHPASSLLFTPLHVQQGYQRKPPPLSQAPHQPLQEINPQPRQPFLLFPHRHPSPVPPTQPFSSPSRPHLLHSLLSNHHLAPVAIGPLCGRELLLPFPLHQHSLPPPPPLQLLP
ncbi:unnamed protein product [Tetraodon nigroviridis]|uniref:(spotted green pufferfish) hypothetical protein n=1 Tax=Tetraodon nigroviridis TaxID=99883 RepID=Q4TGE2_TETNG|nr:unnamed protein product [Tetraodon nigroviridis]